MKRKCHPMTKMCYPDPITVEEFYHELETAKEPFIANMKKMMLPEKRYPEDWIETLRDWIEMEKE